MSLVWSLRARHVTLLACPTPGFKPKPQGPRLNPSPRGGGLGVFSQPTPQPKPHTHSLKGVGAWVRSIMPHRTINGLLHHPLSHPPLLAWIKP
ncbi:hypothetical protein Hanom_Chr14g01264201 [Helianthus anomalus]